MIEILTYISLISGGLLVLLLLAGILSGLDLDLDFDGADGDGGVGYVKGGLTFISIGSWVVKLVLATSASPVVAFTAGIIAGTIAVYLLIKFMNFLLSQQSEVNWEARDALFETGQVYLRIPAQGTGIVRVNIRGGNRELKARSQAGEILPTGLKVRVEDVEDGILVVSRV
ncbi:hypothetical protein CEQ90_04810 [Lewinellaceae bacterium SD302]|nr:hypothetical protein CEQ90_04810 [Lewinellaceae bacterium SD302]